MVSWWPSPFIRLIRGATLTAPSRSRRAGQLAGLIHSTRSCALPRGRYISCCMPLCGLGPMWPGGSPPCRQLRHVLCNLASHRHVTRVRHHRQIVYMPRFEAFYKYGALIGSCICHVTTPPTFHPHRNLPYSQPSERGFTWNHYMYIIHGVFTHSAALDARHYHLRVPPPTNYHLRVPPPTFYPPPGTLRHFTRRRRRCHLPIHTPSERDNTCLYSNNMVTGLIHACGVQACCLARLRHFTGPYAAPLTAANTARKALSELLRGL